MIKILLRLVVRNFLKDKVLNTLNLVGLCIGLIAFGLVVLFGDHELSYDSFHFDPQNTYRLEAKTNSDFWFKNLGLEHGKKLRTGVHPEIKKIVQVTSTNRAFLNYDEKQFF